MLTIRRAVEGVVDVIIVVLPHTPRNRQGREVVEGTAKDHSGTILPSNPPSPNLVALAFRIVILYRSDFQIFELLTHPLPTMSWEPVIPLSLSPSLSLVNAAH